MRNKLKERSGTTMVELLVTFALMAILMTAVTVTLSSGLRVYMRIRDLSSAVSVSNLILDKVTGELNAARVPGANRPGYYLWLDPLEPSQWIAFESKYGGPAILYVDQEDDDGAGQLYLKYYEKADTAEYIWSFAPGVYMGYEIRDLSFELDETIPGMIKINLTLYHRDHGYTYQTSSYARNNTIDVTQNMDYVCRRNDGNLARPASGSEFYLSPGDHEDETECEDRSKITICYVEQDTGIELQEQVIHYGRPGDRIRIYADYIPEYENDGNSSKAVTFGREDSVYLFYYSKKPAVYYLRYADWFDQELTERTTGQIRPGESLTVIPPVIEGFSADQEQYVFAADQDQRTYEFTIRYHLTRIPCSVAYYCGDMVLGQETLITGIHGETAVISARVFDGYSVVGMDEIELLMTEEHEYFNQETQRMEIAFYYQLLRDQEILDSAD